MTSVDDVRLLPGQEPEFSRMSLRPGIGLPSLHEFASVLLEYDLDKTLPDVPANIGIGKGEKGLGRYLRRGLRALTGKEKNAPAATLQEMEDQMREVRQAAFDASRPLKEVLVEANEGRRLSMMKRRQIYETRKKL